MVSATITRQLGGRAACARACARSQRMQYPNVSKHSMKTHSIVAATLSLVSVLGLSGCVAYPPTDGAFPDPDRAWTKEGSFPNMDNLRMVAPGQTKQQVDELIGPPHFNEAVFFVRDWNYLFHLHNVNQTMTCQFQVRFDRHSRVASTQWRDHACADLVGVKPADDASSSTSSGQ